MPIRQQISAIIREAVEGSPGADPALLDEATAVDFGRDPAHGDLTCPVAMRLAKAARRNPREIAEEVAAAIRAASDRLGGAVERVEVAGPGFLNLFLSRAHWLDFIRVILSQGPRYGRSNVGSGRRVQVEFASANPTGPLSVAHGRQAALGDVLANILTFIGFDVTTEYWVNDWGAQIDKLGESVYVHYRHALGDRSETFPDDGYKGDYVVQMGRDLAATEGRTYADLPRDEAIRALGCLTSDRILEQIRADFRQFGVEHDSVFSQRGFEREGHVERLLERLRQAGLTYEEDGALWLRTDAYGDAKPRVLVKSDGSWAYRLSDVAYHESKFDRGFQWVIDLLGPDHHGHIQTMQAAMRSLGHDVSSVRFLVVQHCTIVRRGEKIKMSTRSGQVITLDEVIREVGADVARFFFLMRKADSHLDFDLELAKKHSLDNPVYYVQYAHARIASILRKAQETGRLGPGDLTRNVYSGASRQDLEALEDRDLALARKLGTFGSVVEHAGLQLEPHRLTTYLREVAAAFHNYYTQCTVVGDDDRLTRARLALVSAVRIVVGNALYLLGVHIPEVM